MNEVAPDYKEDPMTKTSRTVAGSVLALTALAAPADLHAQGLDAESIDAAVERIRSEVGVPGVAIAVVRGDSVVHAKGYGVREVGSEEPVDAGTLFAIGSATKAFTATVLGTLIDDGLLGWDDRVVDRLPGFSLRDPWVTAEITIRDLLAHRSGLPPANLAWLTTNPPADTLIRRLRWLEPAAGFRSAFTYQNALYVAAGRIAEEATGRRWDALLAERILAPLGMDRTNTSVDSLAGEANVATPHAVVDGEVVAVPYRSLRAVAPAGAINSSASDLARWLRFLVAGGEAGGEQLLAAATLAETRTPQIVVPADPVMTAFHPAARVQAYGMGWFVSDFHGRTLVAHGGGIDGMSALVAWIPEEELGVAIMANLQTPAPVWIYGILYGVLDPALGVEPTDWETPAARVAEMVDSMFVNRPDPERVADAPPSLPLSAYPGTYAGRALGEATVAIDSGRLVFEHGSLRGTLEHWHHDTFRVRWEDPAWRAAAGAGWISFRLGRAGEVEALDLEAIPGERERLEREGA